MKPSLFHHDLGVLGSSSQTEAYITFIILTDFKLVKWRSGYIGRSIIILTQTVIGSSPFFLSFSFLFCFILFFFLSVCFSWQSENFA